MQRNGLRERVGRAIGDAGAPAIAAIARARRARTFHAEGLTFAAHVSPVVDSPYEAVARRLGRNVLARLSPALWRGGRERPDVLGIALRFHRGAHLTARVAPTDQDLLFATVRSPLTLFASPLLTDVHDFLGNRCWAVSPFALPDGARVQLRLSPVDPPPTHGTRAERLRAAVARGGARWQLEARRTWTRHWRPMAVIALEAPIDVDETALRFDPFQNGAGIVPVGLVHAIRRGAYAASQVARAQ